MTPPDVRPFLFSEKGQAELHPKDFDTALRVAQRIAGLSAAERVEYLARVQGTTTDWRQFEASIELYITERELRGEVAGEREDTMTELFELDDLYAAYTDWLDAIAMRGHRGGAMAIWIARRALEDAMRPHGFESIDEVHEFFEPRVAAFERAFEKEALLVADEMLDRYRHVLWVEKERLLEPGELKVFFGELTAAGDDLEPLADRWSLLREPPAPGISRARPGGGRGGGPVPACLEAGAAAGPSPQRRPERHRRVLRAPGVRRLRDGEVPRAQPRLLPEDP